MNQTETNPKNVHANLIADRIESIRSTDEVSALTRTAELVQLVDVIDAMVPAERPTMKAVGASLANGHGRTPAQVKSSIAAFGNDASRVRALRKVALVVIESADVMAFLTHENDLRADDGLDPIWGLQGAVKAFAAVAAAPKVAETEADEADETETTSVDAVPDHLASVLAQIPHLSDDDWTIVLAARAQLSDKRSNLLYSVAV